MMAWNLQRFRLRAVAWTAVGLAVLGSIALLAQTRPS